MHTNTLKQMANGVGVGDIWTIKYVENGHIVLKSFLQYYTMPFQIILTVIFLDMVWTWVYV